MRAVLARAMGAGDARVDDGGVDDSGVGEHVDDLGDDRVVDGADARDGDVDDDVGGLGDDHVDDDDVGDDGFDDDVGDIGGHHVPDNDVDGGHDHRHDRHQDIQHHHQYLDRQNHHQHDQRQDHQHIIIISIIISMIISNAINLIIDIIVNIIIANLIIGIIAKIINIITVIPLEVGRAAPGRGRSRCRAAHAAGAHGASAQQPGPCVVRAVRAALADRCGARALPLRPDGPMAGRGGVGVARRSWVDVSGSF